MFSELLRFCGLWIEVRFILNLSINLERVYREKYISI